MPKLKTRYGLISAALGLLILSGCKNKVQENSLFDVLESKETGLDFSNKLENTQEFNLFKYMYFYNGSGVGAGDFNNDGLIDVFFASNQGENKLYLNSGELKFKDVTVAAKIPQDKGWHTGVSVVDINNDGLLDIYVCRVSKLEHLQGHNQLLVCQGLDKNNIPTYKEMSAEYGLDFSGFSTQSAFFDYDLDGDLDMFLLNHAKHENGSFAERKNFIGTYSEISGDRLYKNDGTKFKDITKECGINSSIIGYGLGIAITDINLDGYPDIYIGNDFHENDYLYINQKNGKFQEESSKFFMHTSQYTMGVDAADANNDGYPEIISVDMLPEDPYVLKRSLGGYEYDIFFQKIAFGYDFQYTRNNLQLNHKGGIFSEVGLYSGVAATDWSWAPLWMDFDNDGLKDLFISNGIPKRMNDMDYINYVSNRQIQESVNLEKGNEIDLGLIDKLPQIKIPNKFYRNQGDLAFSDVGNQINLNVSSYSNGAAYADFDNDGDLDIVVNNIDQSVLLYNNKCNDRKDKDFAQYRLQGPPGNINAVGARLYFFKKDKVQSYEKYQVHGFQSSMEIPLHVGLSQVTPDSALLVWPDNTYQRLKTGDRNKISLSYKSGLPVFDYSVLSSFSNNNSNPAKDISGEVGFGFLHKENRFAEFDREPLIPHMVSTEGPALAVADINRDGLDDVFLGSSRGTKSAIFIQNASGKFIRSHQPAIDNDSTYEDVDACWVDVNNDDAIDLVVASGGNEFYGSEEYLLPRVYLNDGKGLLVRKLNSFDQLFQTFSCIEPFDFNGDGHMDIFLGGRAVPWDYGVTPASYLLQNDGTGKFKDVTEANAQELSRVGFVTQALWFDLDKNGKKDLLLSLEWGQLVAFLNTGNGFQKKSLTEKKGWWNFIYPADLDNDGDIDLVAGNLGLNSRLKTSTEEPVNLYYFDFDENGKKDQVLTYYLQGKQIPFASKTELEKQMPGLKKKFLYAEDFAKASLTNIFPAAKLKASSLLTADYFANSVLINNGNLEFNLQPLPPGAQFTSFRDAVSVDANNDSLSDILLVGNYYENNIEMGRYDADFGTLLINKGNGQFETQELNGLRIKGQARHVQQIRIANRIQTFLLALNNDSARIIELKKGQIRK